jgi:hypothetical protein
MAVPRLAHNRRQRVAWSLHNRQRVGKLAFNDHQPLVGSAGINCLNLVRARIPFLDRVADFVDESFAWTYASTLFWRWKTPCATLVRGIPRLPEALDGLGIDLKPPG